MFAAAACTIQLVSHHFVESYDPTIESCYRQQFVVDNQVAVLDILDTAGQDDYSALRSSWIRSGEGFIILYSVTDRMSFAEAENYRLLILRVKDVDASALPPLILVGNKVDLASERKVSTQEGVDLSSQWGVDFFEVSAKTRENLQEAFFQLVRRVRQRRVKSDTKVTKQGSDTSHPATGSTKKKRGGGCVLL